MKTRIGLLALVTLAAYLLVRPAPRVPLYGTALRAGEVDAIAAVLRAWQVPCEVEDGRVLVPEALRKSLAERLAQECDPFAPESRRPTDRAERMRGDVVGFASIAARLHDRLERRFGLRADVRIFSPDASCHACEPVATRAAVTLIAGAKPGPRAVEQLKYTIASAVPSLHPRNIQVYVR